MAEQAAVSGGDLRRRRAAFFRGTRREAANDQDALERLANDALDEAALGEGIRQIPESMRGSMLRDMTARLHQMDPAHRASVHKGSPVLNDTARLTLGALTEPQLIAMRHGYDPSNPAVIQVISSPQGVEMLQRKLPLSQIVLALAAARGDTSESRDGGVSSYTRSRAMTDQGTGLSAVLVANYASSLGASKSEVQLAANYVSNRQWGLGFSHEETQRYAGHFVGTSADFRKNLHEKIANGEKLTDDHIHGRQDVAGTIAAVQAGRLKPDQVPPSVKGVMDQMRAKGIDPATADAAQIKRFFEANPKALEEAKKLNGKDLSSAKSLSGTEIQGQNKELLAQSTKKQAPNDKKVAQNTPRVGSW